MKKVYLLLCALPFLFAVNSGWAQSADMPRHGSSVTGLNDPEPASPRYLKAEVLAQLQREQEQPQAEALTADQPTSSPALPATPGPTLPSSSMSLRKQ